MIGANLSEKVRKGIVAFEGTHVDCWKKYRKHGASLPVVQRLRKVAGVKGRVWQHFTEAETQRLLELRAQGKHASDIARALGRSPQNIYDKIKDLGLNKRTEPKVSESVAKALAEWDRFFARQDRNRTK